MSVTSAEFVSVQTQVSLLISSPVTETTTGIVVIPTIRRVLAADAAPTADGNLNNITGLSVSVTNGGIYKMEAFLMIQKAATTNVIGFGFTIPAVTRTRGSMWMAGSATQAAWTVTVRGHHGWWGDAGSGSIVISAAAEGYVSTTIIVKGLIIPSADGVWQMQSKVTSAGQTMAVYAGSYIEVYRIG